MSKADIERRLEIVKSLIEVFRLERIVYLSVSVVALAALLGSAVLLLTREEPPVSVLTLLLGSSGAIALTHARLLRMWSDALKFLLPVVTEKGATHD